LNFDIAILEVAKFQLRDVSGHVRICLVFLTAEKDLANSDRVRLVVIVTYKILSVIAAMPVTVFREIADKGFRYSLTTYNVRYMHYRFSVLAMNIGTQPK